MTVSPFPCGKGVFFYENNLCRPPAHNPPRRAHTFVEMEKKAISGNLQEDCAQLKALLPAQDILSFSFSDETKRQYVCLFADALTDKDLLAEQALRPLMHYAGEEKAAAVAQHVLSPEVRTQGDFQKLAEEILAGNPVLLWEGADEGLIVGTKKITVRTVAEPPTDVAIKGPREGFIEDIKTNTSLVRRRLKTNELQTEMLSVGRRSATSVALCWIEGTCKKEVLEEVRRKLSDIDIDIVADSSYLTRFLADRPYSLVKQVGTTEKPDIFCAKLAEGRVGILVDGSPIALTVPYLLIGCAWAAMLAMPFTIVTNALDGSHMGAYLGLFNGTICIPQIIAAALGGVVLSLVGSVQSNMMLVAGVLLIAGAATVGIIKESVGERQDKA